MDKPQLVLIWGFTLLLAQEWLSGDLTMLIELISSTGPPTGNIGGPGLLVKIAGQVILIVIVWMFSEAGDEEADFALAFMGGLTLLFLVTETASLQKIFTALGLP